MHRKGQQLMLERGERKKREHLFALRGAGRKGFLLVGKKERKG